MRPDEAHVAAVEGRAASGPGASGARSLPRCQDGTIDNCSLKFREPEKDCQVCAGSCPDAANFYPGGNPVGFQTLFAEAMSKGTSGSRDPEVPFPLSEGDVVEVSWGQATYTPVKFCSFTVGPFTARTTVRPGETGEEARGRLLAFLRRSSDESFAEQLRTFLRRVEEAAREADKAAERSRGR